MSWIIALGVNAVIYLVSAAKDYSHIEYGLVGCVVAECVLNLVAVNVMEKLTASKPYIAVNSAPREAYKGEWVVSTIQSSVVKGVLHYGVLHYGVLHYTHTTNASVNPLAFILKSFCFELTFDLVHYWLHRGMHAIPAVYRAVHKQHHKHHHPRAHTAFYMSVPDLLLSYGVPLVVSLAILARFRVSFGRHEVALLTTYLTYQEVGGHMGKRMAPTSSFAQCVWLPRWLGIELYTEDHDLHHSHLNVNYSKRFKVWDILFGTYSPRY